MLASVLSYPVRFGRWVSSLWTACMKRVRGYRLLRKYKYSRRNALRWCGENLKYLTMEPSPLPPPGLTALDLEQAARLRSSTPASRGCTGKASSHTAKIPARHGSTASR